MYGSCKPVAPGFVSHGANLPSGVPIQGIYSTLTQDPFGTAVKGVECSWSSDIVMQGSASESQGCMMRPAGTCQFLSSDYCHDGAEFMCPTGFSSGSSQYNKATAGCILGLAGQFSNSTSTSHPCDAGRFCLSMT